MKALALMLAFAPGLAYAQSDAANPCLPIYQAVAAIPKTVFHVETAAGSTLTVPLTAKALDAHLFDGFQMVTLAVSLTASSTGAYTPLSVVNLFSDGKLQPIPDSLALATTAAMGGGYTVGEAIFAAGNPSFPATCAIVLDQTYDSLVTVTNDPAATVTTPPTLSDLSLDKSTYSPTDVMRIRFKATGAAPVCTSALAQASRCQLGSFVRAYYDGGGENDFADSDTPLPVADLGGGFYEATVQMSSFDEGDHRGPMHIGGLEIHDIWGNFTMLLPAADWVGFTLTP